MIYHARINQKKAGMAIVISDREGFRQRKHIRDKEGVLHNITWPILQEGIIILTMYALHNRGSSINGRFCVKQKLKNLQEAD